MIKKILSIVSFLTLSFVGTVAAQVPTPSQAFFTPKKGDIMASFNFGVGSYVGKSAPQPNLGSYSLSAPNANFEKSPMLDIEGRYFITDTWAVKLSGGFAYNKSKAHSEKPGTATGETLEVGDIPTYNAIPSASNLQFAITVGADKYIPAANYRMMFRLGGEFGFAYGRASANADDETYAGVAVGEAYAFRMAPVVGLDYALSMNLFVGFDIRPIAYSYSVYGIRPQAGLGMMKSDIHGFSFLSQPMIKLGVKF